MITLLVTMPTALFIFFLLLAAFIGAVAAVLFCSISVHQVNKKLGGKPVHRIPDEKLDKDYIKDIRRSPFLNDRFS